MEDSGFKSNLGARRGQPLLVIRAHAAPPWTGPRKETGCGLERAEVEEVPSEDQVWSVCPLIGSVASGFSPARSESQVTATCSLHSAPSRPGVHKRPGEGQHTHTCTHVHMHMCVQTHINMCGCVCVCVCARACVCRDTCAPVLQGAHTGTHVHTQAHTSWPTQAGSLDASRPRARTGATPGHLRARG